CRITHRRAGWSGEVTGVTWWADWILKAFRPAEVLKNLWTGAFRSSDLERSPEDAKPKSPASEEVVGADYSVESAPTEITTISDFSHTDQHGREDKVPFQAPVVGEDDESRRKLIRTLFNDFWMDASEKPVSFAERLDVAEEYINLRLA